MKNQELIKLGFFLAIVIILVLAGVLILREPKQITNNDNEKVLRDSIALMQSQIDSSHVRQIKLQSSYDSLLNIEPEIRYRTNEKIKFIYSTATPSQLDSIIRTNWKTQY
jgi:hypothetical protein